MCGIAGVVELGSGREPSREALQRMGRVMAHRGPDEEGYYQSGPVGLAHRRLSIIDLSSGQQPMHSPDGQATVIFNGEIYNYLELKLELEQRGHVFRTKSDTEVLLALYRHAGLEAFPKINAMLTCAIWDHAARRLVLARDRFGKKPLFYYQDAQRFLFGSEIKALLAYGGIEPKVNVAALHDYLTNGYIVGDHTILEGIHRLAPAHVLTLQDGRVTCRPYWELEFRPAAAPPREADVIERVQTLLESAVERRLMSEVPLGAFLSGGLDSSVVVALMARSSGRAVKTFTIGFEEADYSELEDARTVARHLATDHHEMIVKPSALDILPDLVWHLDEPFGDSSAVPTYYVCKAARQHVTVALSGDGGDEVFAGYRRYLELGRYSSMERVPGWARRGLIRPMAERLPFTWPGWNYLHALGSWERGGLPSGLGLYPHIQSRLYTGDVRQRLGEFDPFGPMKEIVRKGAHLDQLSRYQYLDTLQYLPADILTKVDRMSMATSLEVRSPLLDHTLVEYMATVPASLKLQGQVSKYVLRKIAARLLPASVLTKPKQGFAIPKDRWFKHELKTFAEEMLLEPRSMARGYFDRRAIEQLLRHHATGRRDYSTWIWCLIVLETWFRLFTDQPRVGV